MLFTARIKELEGQLGDAQAQAQTNFSLLTAANEALAQAEEQNLALTGELATATAPITTLNADLVTVRAELATANGLNTTLNTDLVTARADLATEQGNRETLIFDQVNVRLAAAGVAPIKRAAETDTPASKTGTKAGTPAQRLAAGFTVAGQS